MRSRRRKPSAGDASEADPGVVHAARYLSRRDFIELAFASGGTMTIPRRTIRESTQFRRIVGFRNANGQTVLRRTNLSGNVAGQHVYVLMCDHCSHEYGANGFDIHVRKCPSCMGGQPGLEY